MALSTSNQKALLKQALAADKVPIGVFVGAGCPVSILVESAGSLKPLIPAIDGITSEVCGALDADTQFQAAFRSIRDQLRQDGLPSPTVEEILSHVRSLKQAAGVREVYGLSAIDLSNLDDEICRLIVRRVHVSLPATKTTPYHHLANWIGAISREYPVQIFTTNYDVLVEEALEAIGVPYFDGFMGAEEPFFDLPSMELDKLPARWARLWKLHGSIGWTQKNGRIFRWPAQFVTTGYVIHPSHLKYEDSRRMPYLAMSDRLSAFLQQSPAVLVVCGYSFRDQHINEVLSQELQGNPRAACFALLYGPLGNYPLAVKAAEVRSNLTLLAEDGAVVGTRREDWQEAADPYPDEGTPGAREKFHLGDFGDFGGFLVEELIRREVR